MEGASGERVVLARRERGLTPIRWTGAEPSDLFEVETAEELGAKWEGTELVTYDLPGFNELYQYYQNDDYLSDND